MIIPLPFRFRINLISKNSLSQGQSQEVVHYKDRHGALQPADILVHPAIGFQQRHRRDNPLWLSGGLIRTGTGGCPDESDYSVYMVRHNHIFVQTNKCDAHLGLSFIPLVV